jgi:hypothetical protein
LFCENGVVGLPMLTLVSAASAGAASAAEQMTASAVSANRNGRRAANEVPLP